MQFCWKQERLFACRELESIGMNFSVGTHTHKMNASSAIEGKSAENMV